MSKQFYITSASALWLAACCCLFETHKIKFFHQQEILKELLAENLAYFDMVCSVSLKD